MQCPRCDHAAPLSSFGDPPKCPACGVFYEKALALKLRKESATVTGAVAKADGVVRSTAAAVSPATERLKRGVAGAREALAASRASRATGGFYCPACGQTGDGVRHVPGSILIELVLWLCFLVPGIIYSIWRHSASTKACHKCHTPGLIPIDSPRARRELGPG